MVQFCVRPRRDLWLAGVFRRSLFGCETSSSQSESQARFYFTAAFAVALPPGALTFQLFKRLVPVPGHQRPSSEPRVRHLRRSFDVGPRGKSAGGAPDSVSAGPRDAEKTTPPPPPTAASPSTLTSSSTVPPPPTAASTSPPASKNKTENQTTFWPARFSTSSEAKVFCQ
mmetsp:Transcript_17768/g.44425  ORF Transcript_17768/g.44425 Transcript_17768/m.44425 type:complete len:170 (+) Transcript_17768:430-939(+)